VGNAKFRSVWTGGRTSKLGLKMGGGGNRWPIKYDEALRRYQNVKASRIGMRCQVQHLLTTWDERSGRLLCYRVCQVCQVSSWYMGYSSSISCPVCDRMACAGS
jgi:hypothetical protein